MKRTVASDCILDTKLTIIDLLLTSIQEKVKSRRNQKYISRDIS